MGENEEGRGSCLHTLPLSRHSFIVASEDFFFLLLLFFGEVCVAQRAKAASTKARLEGQNLFFPCHFQQGAKMRALRYRLG